MTQPISIDITGQEALTRAAEEVSKAGSRAVLTRDGEAVALLVPLPKRSRSRAAKALTNKTWLRDLTDLGPSQGSTDISENHDKYLAQAYHAESHPSK